MIMKKIFACLVLTFLYSAACQAAKPAIFGVWEQIVVAPANSKSSPSRRNFLFLSGTISTQEIFSGVSDSYDGTICCLNISGRPRRLNIYKVLGGGATSTKQFW